MEAIPSLVTITHTNGKEELIDGFVPCIEQEEMDDFDYSGFCIVCGTLHDGYEPDARECECEICGAPTGVYGIEELLLMGLVSIE